VFENGLLRRIFRPKKDEVTAGLRKVHNEELHNSYSSTSLIRMIKSTWMRWSVHVPRMEQIEMHIRYWWKRQKERDQYEDDDVGGRIILKCVLMGWGSMD
jgi:hypothetical protein